MPRPTVFSMKSLEQHMGGEIDKGCNGSYPFNLFREMFYRLFLVGFFMYIIICIYLFGMARLHSLSFLSKRHTGLKSVPQKMQRAAFCVI